MGYTENVLGNTGCLFLRGSCLPYYCITEREWVLIDSGSRFVRDEMTEYLETHGIRIKAVLCSHGHFDHTENNRYLQERYGTKIIMTPFDAGLLQNEISLKAVFYCYSSSETGLYKKEMICRADQIFEPDQKYVDVDGARFEILDLPGHAGSHKGFVTPDGVAYLADSIFTRDAISKNKLFYMLCWKEALKTMDRVKELHYNRYILAHGGICDEVAELAEENKIHFQQLLDSFEVLCDGTFTLDELTIRTIHAFGSHADQFEKAYLIKRMVRYMVEYLLDKHRLRQEIQDGIFIYSRR